MTTATDTIILRGCTDCLMLIANGDTSGNSRCETEEGEAAYIADVDRQTEGLHLCPGSWPFDTVAVGDTEDGYSIPEGEGDAYVIMDGTVYQVDWSEDDREHGRDGEGRFTYDGCEVCGSRLGGDKYPIAAWPV